MITYKILYLSMIVRLHDYALPDAWSNSFDSIYSMMLNKYELNQDLDIHSLKSFAVIESRQIPNIRGGGGNAYYGLFQISRDLAMFSGFKHKEVLDPYKNGVAAGKSFLFYKRIFMKRGYKPSKYSIEYRTALFYGAHNAGPNIIKRCLKTKTLESLVVCYAKKLMLNGYSRKSAIYRASLALLAVWLRKLSIAGGPGKISIKWWICRDYALAKYVGMRWNLKKRLTWSSRTKLLLFIQASEGLPLTGVWTQSVEQRLQPFLHPNCRR